jgi:hypothetical protein
VKKKKKRLLETAHRKLIAPAIAGAINLSAEDFFKDGQKKLF